MAECLHCQINELVKAHLGQPELGIGLVGHELQ